MANGMRKGSAFEREICKTLSLWWTGGDRDDVFWRTAGSGARATTRKKSGVDTFGQHGDVQATDPIGQPLLDMFSIEIKRGYNTATPLEILELDKKKSEWMSFCHQAAVSMRLSGSKYWMLIHKRDRHEPHITVGFLVYDFVGLYSVPSTAALLIIDGRLALHCRLDAFLNQYDPSTVEQDFCLCAGRDSLP